MRIVLTVVTAAMPLLVSCNSVPREEAIRNDQTRFEQQTKRYQDRLSSEQEAEDAARARQEDRLKTS